MTQFYESYNIYEKVFAEGRNVEIKQILYMITNTRSLIVSLSAGNNRKWTSESCSIYSQYVSSLLGDFIMLLCDPKNVVGFSFVCVKNQTYSWFARKWPQQQV